MKIIYFLFALTFLQPQLFAQKSKADSLENLLANQKTDTGRVRLMWELVAIINSKDPEKALSIAQQALVLASKIKYVEGQSKALGAMAIIFSKIGNYPKALEFNLLKLQLEEKRNNPKSLAKVLMNIGAVYSYQEEYKKALLYYYKSDSVINEYKFEDLKYYSLLNLGDVYNRMNDLDSTSSIDSAFSYFNKSLILANFTKDNDFIGASMTGLGHVYRKQKNYPLSQLNYQMGISYLKAADDDDLVCEATLGLARLYQNFNKNDSAVYYASLSLSIAMVGDRFMGKQLDATRFLTDHYKRLNNIDKAFVYLEKTQQLNDTLNSKSRIRESQIFSSNEQLRQLELEETRKKAEQERRQQLQYLFIGIFIPGIFLLTLLLSRIKIHIRVIKILGILSLLVLFEFLTLFLHPRVAILTDHTPVYEMLIFVTIAALLIPAHHRIETWLIKKLTHRREGPIRFKKVKLKMKGPEN